MSTMLVRHSPGTVGANATHREDQTNAPTVVTASPCEEALKKKFAIPAAP